VGLRALQYKKESLLRNVTQDLGLEKFFGKERKQKKMNTTRDVVLTKNFEAEKSQEISSMKLKFWILLYRTHQGSCGITKHITQRRITSQIRVITSPFYNGGDVYRSSDTNP
jgi:hypothetical protein